MVDWSANNFILRWNYFFFLMISNHWIAYFFAEQESLLRILSAALFLQNYLIDIYVELLTPISLNDWLSANNNNNVRLSSLLMKNVLVSWRVWLSVC